MGTANWSHIHCPERKLKLTPPRQTQAKKKAPAKKKAAAKKKVSLTNNVSHPEHPARQIAAHHVASTVFGPGGQTRATAVHGSVAAR